MSFYEYMMHYPHDIPERLALAENMKKMAPRHKELREIDSMMDLFLAERYLTDDEAAKGITGSLWCEYCIACNRPIN